MTTMTSEQNVSRFFNDTTTRGTMKKQPTKKTLFKEDRQAGTWCEMEVELKNGTLSICGSEGGILTEEKAEKAALDSWVSFFEDQPDQRREMNDRFNKSFRTARGAARFVVETDGKFHGLDVHREEDGLVYITQGCGQIVDELKKWFPEHAEFLPYHLNDLHAGTERQEAFLRLAEEKGIGDELRKKDHYSWACEVLKKAGLYEDEEFLHDYSDQFAGEENKSRPYIYGTAWLKRELPQKVLDWFASL